MLKTEFLRAAGSRFDSFAASPFMLVIDDSTADADRLGLTRSVEREVRTASRRLG